MRIEGTTYQSNALFTTAVLIFFSLFFLLKIILVSSYMYSIYLLNNLINSPSELIRQDFISSLNFSDSMTRYNVIIFILCAVSFSLWIYRTNKNLSSLRITGLEFTPALSVWSFYIPLLCLYWPFKAVAEIWKASQPDATNTGESWKNLSTPLIIPIWWISFIGAGILSHIINTYYPPHSLSEIKMYLFERIVIELLFLVATILISFIVYKINENQNNKLIMLNTPVQNSSVNV
ncbi:TPA: DUF4328 domain-containing protein [Legionella pneumophila]|nr:DUF4328 domain-containing protein [Legionella pneumophila]